MPRPIRALIDVHAVRHNVQVARGFAGASRILAVAKANAYGHGLMHVLPALGACDGIGLLEIDAACQLRAAGYTKPIVLLEGFFDEDDLTTMAQHGLSPVVHSARQLDTLMRVTLSAPLCVWLKMNTGMNRLGFAPTEFHRALAALAASANVSRTVLMTHFASSDDGMGVADQIALFDRTCRGGAHARSLANSAALIAHAASRADWVRPGIMLYGASPFADREASALGLRPAMHLTSRLIAVQQVKAGDTVGYGMAFRAVNEMRIGIVACGYADGYPRHAPTGTPIAVEGIRTRTVGRVSMDMIYVDLTPVPQANVGSAVELWGNTVSVDDVATASGTVGYELLCALAPRVPVAVVDDGALS